MMDSEIANSEMGVEGGAAGGDLPRGVAAIQAALRMMPSSPGVYRMLGAKGDVLYVGKAKNLKRRVTSYANPAKQSIRIRRMISLVATMEVVTTHTEVEALLLEANLIKTLKPRYNITLRDDKSFPYLVIRSDHPWPQLIKYRGTRKPGAEHFGPFASAGAVNQTLNALQRAFPLRTCSDTVFDARTRPCLQYQIKRCTGPCCGLIADADYRALVAEVRDVLLGRGQDVRDGLVRRMNEAAEGLDFEKAAVVRDRIRALAHVQARQGINLPNLGEADVIAVHQEGGGTCVQVFFFRAGFNYGNRAYFPTQAHSAAEGEIMAAFLGQFYTNKEIPPLLLLSHAAEEHLLVEQALTMKAGRKVDLVVPRRGAKRGLVEQALVNAREALARHAAETGAQAVLLAVLAERFDLAAPPDRIEIYDNSHIQGAQALGAMVVAGPEGFVRGAYRKFTIRSAGGDGITAGDDYGMMREVLTRRFTRLLKEQPERSGGVWPDLLLIDGGAGQIAAAKLVLDEIGVDLPLIGIAKGPERDAGRERFFVPGREPIRLPERDPLLWFLQRLRDEAHRFAIGGHRAKRSAAIGRSTLDEIPGIGGRRKRALLHHFGSARAVATAGLPDLEQVTGISHTVAQRIYDHFHGERQP
ncbi:MAG: excinuclease ABC subunit UvrC [Alphaproteobacteria bacterium]|nr:excinuclease ABC subunit UvrC [Alphaproteobacteria bacterium]